MEKETCALCHNVAILRKSHIIPKFVSKWLKETSATGFLRGVKKPNERKQDLPKLPLLCENCEQILSRLEKYFATKIFYPVLYEQKKEILYDDRLLLFLLSLSWRTLKTSYFDQIEHYPWIKEHVDKADEVWRKSLLAESIVDEKYEHHMFFLDYIEKETGIPERFQWYTMRATDATLASNQEVVFAFTHFARIFFVSSIFPSSFSGWKNTKIEKNGKLTMKWKIDDTTFWEFLVNRGSWAISSLGVSTDKRILKSMKKDSKKILKSESLKVMIEESKRARLKRIKDLPEGIRFLIDLVDSTVDSLKLNLTQKSWARYTRHMIAEDLSRIPSDRGKIIDSMIESTIMLTDNEHRQNHFDFATQELMTRFMVSICNSKNEQIELLEKTVDALIKQKAVNDERIIVVFSYNPSDKELPYEIAYSVS
jgi:hypothetical protein